MRGLLLCVGILLFGLNSAHAGESVTFKASLTNLTKGQVMTPPVLVVHQSSFSLFTLGEEASDGLKAQSQDGVTDFLTVELAANQSVNSYTVGDSGPILPGETQEILFSGSRSAQLSVSSMLASTNDAFVSYRGFPLNFSLGEKQVVFLYVYDSGAETNNELCTHIPGPPCGNPFVPTAGNEGYVHFHPGLGLQDDLDQVRAFANIAAKIEVERIK